MNKSIALAAALFVLLASGCSSSLATTPATPPRKIRIAFSGEYSVRDIPFLRAVDSLKGQGYSIEITQIARNDLIPEIMSRGDADLGSVGTQFVWSAIAKGAKIRTIANKANMTLSITAKREIKSCRDLASQPIAYPVTQGVTVLMLNMYIKQNCPGGTPQLILIGDGKNRMAGLLKGEISAALLDIEEVEQLDQQAPGKFHSLIQFGKEFPGIQLTMFNVGHEWAEQNPGIIKDFIHALLIEQRRLIGNPQMLSEQAGKLLSLDPTVAKTTSEIFSAANVWNVNGGLTTENIRYTIDFLASAGSLPAGLKPDDVADLSYLNAVLDEIGRK